MGKWLWVGDSLEHGSLQPQAEEAGSIHLLLAGWKPCGFFNLMCLGLLCCPCACQPSDFCVRVCAVSNLHRVAGTSAPIPDRGDAALLPLHPPLQHASSIPVP